MAVIGSRQILRVAVRSMEMDAVMGMHSRHDGQWMRRRQVLAFIE
jgi:hypothetical protein